MNTRLAGAPPTTATNTGNVFKKLIDSFRYLKTESLGVVNVFETLLTLLDGTSVPEHLRREMHMEIVRSYERLTEKISCIPKTVTETKDRVLKQLS